MQASDGNFYGTTTSQVFKLTPSGQLTLLHEFAVSGISRLIQGIDGNLYGTTVNGGTTNNGMIFRLTLQGVATILHNFGDGA